MSAFCHYAICPGFLHCLLNSFTVFGKELKREVGLAKFYCHLTFAYVSMTDWPFCEEDSLAGGITILEISLGSHQVHSPQVNQRKGVKKKKLATKVAWKLASVMNGVKKPHQSHPGTTINLLLKLLSLPFVVP